jgi:hypothetical protein
MFTVVVAGQATVNNVANAAVTVTGPDIVTVVAAAAAFATGPVQPLNANPEFAVAETFCTDPAAKKFPLAGVTVPPAPAAVVNRYSVSNVAVKVVADPGATTECEIAPASLQLLNTYRVPPEPCGETVAIVWFDPGTQLNTCGAANVFPSTIMLSPAGTVCTVMPTLAVKFAVTLTGPLMVTVVAALAAFATGPVQFANTNPEFAVAVTFCTEPAGKNVPLAGETVPPAPAEVVN